MNHHIVSRKDSLLVALILVAALMIAPIEAKAYQISPNPNPIGGFIIVGYSGPADNGENFSNYGVLGINGSTLTNDFFATLTNCQGGILNNARPFINDSGATLTNNGSLENSGTLTDWDTLYNASNLTNYGSGTLNNYGYLYNLVTGWILNNSTPNGYYSRTNNGTVTNNGTLNIVSGTLHSTRPSL